jgi:hypothetical protein
MYHIKGELLICKKKIIFHKKRAAKLLLEKGENENVAVFKKYYFPLTCIL